MSIQLRPKRRKTLLQPQSRWKKLPRLAKKKGVLGRVLYVQREQERDSHRRTNPASKETRQRLSLRKLPLVLRNCSFKEVCVNKEGGDKLDAPSR